MYIYFFSRRNIDVKRFTFNALFITVLLTRVPGFSFLHSLCRYFPYKDDSNHKLVKAIGNVTRGLEVTIQFAVKPEFREGESNVFHATAFFFLVGTHDDVCHSFPSEGNTSVPTPAALHDQRPRESHSRAH